MPNPRTGNFDVVAQGGLRLVERLLAVHHSRERYPHNGSFLLPIRREPGAGDVAGEVRFQVGNPGIALPSTGGSRIEIHYPVYARFLASPGSAAAPETIHGDLRVGVDVDQVLGTDDSILHVDLSASDIDVDFVPARGLGLAAAEVSTIVEQARGVLASGFDPVNMVIELPEGGELSVDHWRFKTHPPGSRSAVGLLLDLSDRTPTAADVAAVSNVFVDTDDGFAVAIDEEFLTRVLQDFAREPIRRMGFSFRVRIRFLGFTIFNRNYTVRPDPDSLMIEFSPGRIRIVLDGGIFQGSSTSPTITFRVTQDFRVAVEGGRVRLRADGDANLDITSGGLTSLVARMFIGRARDLLTGVGGQIEAQANPEIDRLLGQLDGFLGLLDLPGASASYRRVDVDADGLVVHGGFSVGSFPNPRATYTSKAAFDPSGGVRGLVTEYDAFESWIPGGTIDTYRWLVLQTDGTIRDEQIEPHRWWTFYSQDYRFTDPSCLWPPCIWCLEIQGDRPSVASGPNERVLWRSCRVGATPPTTVGIPRPGGRDPGDPRVTVTVVDPGGSLRGHLDPWATVAPGSIVARSEEGTGSTALVHFANPKLADNLSEIKGALSEREDRGWVVQVISVLDEEDGEGRGVVGHFPAFGWAFDAEGGWKKLLQAEAGTTVLLTPNGKTVWRHDDTLDAESLGRALDEHVKPPKGQVLWTRTRLATEVGDEAPDVTLTYHKGTRVALRKLKGRPTILCFWTGWSTPALDELRRLDAFAKQQGKKLGKAAPRIFAINDRQPEDEARAAFKKLGLDLDRIHLVVDEEGDIARRYGVSMWPTTVTVGRDGAVEDIRFGWHPDEQFKPQDPKDPQDPVDPRDPKDPEDPRGPVDPVDPTDPIDPVGPGGGEDPLGPIGPRPGGPLRG